MECILNKFTNDAKTDTPERPTAIWRDHNKLEKWADKSLMNFSKGKCKVLLLGQSIPIHQRTLGATQLASSFAEKHPGGHKVDDEPTVCPCSKAG